MHFYGIRFFKPLIIIFLCIFYTVIFNEFFQSYACGGTFYCGTVVNGCKTPGGAPCFDCSAGNPGNCSYQSACEDLGGFDRACGAAGAVCAYGCGVTGCILADGCYDDTAIPPTSSCGPSNCFNSIDSNGCERYGVCSGGSCVQGGLVDSSCGAVPTPTSVPGCTITSTYCGSACVACGVTSDRYLDTCGNCVTTTTISGNWCDQCSDGCAEGQMSCTGTGGGVPTPTPGGSSCGPGSHAESCLCGGDCASGTPGCCADGTSCTAVSGGSYVCQGGTTGGGSCIENSNFNSFAFVDTDNNNEQTQPVFPWSSEANVPNAGSIRIDYTSRVQQVEVVPGHGVYVPQLVSGSGTYNDSIDDFGITSSPYSYNGSLSFSNSTSNTLKGASIRDYVCWFGGSVLYSDQYISGNGPWPVTVNTYQAQFAYQPQISFGGNVFIDTDNDGIRDAGESGYNGAVVGISGGGASATTNSSGNYTFTGKAPGIYTLTLNVPSGYTMTSGSTNPRTLAPTNGQNNINFGIRQSPPVCVPGLTANPTTVNPGSTSTLLINNCTGKDPTSPDPVPPDTDWDPDGPEANEACSDSLDNDGDGLSDTNDPGCHTDGNPANPGSYNPDDDSEIDTGGPNPQCSDGVDNDGDGLSDANDPGCHDDNGKDSDGDGNPNSSDSDDDGDGIPDASDPDDDGDGINDNSDPDWTGTYNPGDDSETNPSNSDADSSITNHTDTNTSSTATWEAPVCPTTPLTVNPEVTVNGPGGQTTYSTAITVPATYRITTNVRVMDDPSEPCSPVAGIPYSSGGASPTGATVNVAGGTINSTQTTSTTTGSTTFSCLPTTNYIASVSVPSGYELTDRVIAPGPGSDSGVNGVSVTNISQNQTVTFCIAPTDPWFQTDLGDVRFVSINNPVPVNKFGAIGENTNNPQLSAYPGIYYSSDSIAEFGAGAHSTKDWVVEDEYSYNADTQNRNGGMSYDFYKAKAKQDGVAVTQLTPGTFLPNQITGNGVYESNGDLTINSYSHIPNTRVVILVNGDVTINDNISIPVGQGLLIIAAKGDMTIGSTVGTATLNSSTSNIDGYYSAQGSITLDGTRCSAGNNPDLRLNVGGALIANSLKPFSTTGTGLIVNNRSLCLQNLNYPSLYVASRPDFLTKFTDFYKTSYTKWQEVNP